VGLQSHLLREQKKKVNDLQQACLYNSKLNEMVGGLEILNLLDKLEFCFYNKIKLNKNLKLIFFNV